MQGRVAIVAAGFLALCVPPLELRAQQASVSGHLTGIWEDPLPELGQPRLRHFLSGRDGELIPLRVTDAQLRMVGGGRAPGGEYVQVTGEWRRIPGTAAERELQVSSIRYASQPAGVTASVQGVPVYGTQRWVTVACRFAGDSYEPHDLTWYQNLLGGTYPGLDHYWREVSFDQVNIVGSVAYGWYDLPHPKGHYLNDSTTVSEQLQMLKEDCSAVADADVYFPDFVGVNFQFNRNLDGFSWGGGAGLITDDGSGFYRMTWMSDWADQFVYGHEMGHGFGLPHSSGPYGNVYDSDWDVMSGARNFWDTEFGWLGPHTISYHKDDLGWIPLDRIYDATLGTTETITLHRLGDMSSPGDYMMARIPLDDGTYYTVEARRTVGYDEYLPPDSTRIPPQPAEAVVLHHVKNRAFVVDPDNDGDPNDEGAQWIPGETFTDGVNGVVVTVESDTPGGDGFIVTIGLTEPGHIEFDPTSLAVTALQGTDAAPLSFALRNTGTGDMDWTASDDVPWLQLLQASGTVVAGGSLDMAATVASSGLAAGTHNAVVTVSGSADNSPQTLPVSLEVTPAPVLTIVSGPIDIEAVLGVDPPVHEVLIRNDGGTELTWSASSDAAWMTFTRGSGTLAAGASETDSVVISVDGLALGSYTGTLTFTGNAPNAPRTVPASMEVVESPSIALEGTLEFEAWEGDAPENEPDLTVTNDGGGTLAWTASVDQEWVSLSVSDGTLTPAGSATIRVTVDGSGLPAGTHTAVISVEGNADDSPQTATVEFVAKVRPVMAPGDVADHLMGIRDVLSQEEIDYLDEIGNANGALDVGDFRAWLQLTGMMGSVRPGGGEEVAP